MQQGSVCEETFLVILKNNHFWNFHAFPKKQKLRWNFFYNHGQNICRLFDALAEFLLTTTESELDYYHQEMIMRVSLQFVELLNTKN